ncbi:siderophore-interacting protein [Labedella gwakjiensis]|uniref:Phage tail protein n=1 Tax=Labedella gwakjiensis TaxID=390269 RepID=A0A2P8GY53_9MICO|nr:SIP domain-containing protein [Labedella gwakjiensis]PSL38897.1 siderophore-interacting protein [Labedella gwakjiensis]RUQ86637.1 phage tail protein [Labedella gwakjiensis]
MTTTSRETTRRRSSSAAESRRLAPFLLACDESAIAELEAMVATLPLCASGRVFVEVASADDIGLIAVPSRMTVTWLPRSARSGAPGTGASCGRGEAVVRAVTAWADEMLCAPAADAVDRPDVRVEVWLGGDYRGVAPAYEHLVHDLGVDATRVTAPVAYRLS